MERQELIGGSGRLSLWTLAVYGGGECAWGKVILSGKGVRGLSGSRGSGAC